MSKKTITFALTAICAVAFGACGGSSSQVPPPSSRIVHGHGAARIVLSAAGAQRIGIATARAMRGPGGTTVVPYSALVYDASGRVFAFSSPARLTYLDVPVRVDHIAGDWAYLRSGPAAGARVVTVGAEELFGVATGVLAQT
jgi:hypothetical protein